MFFVLNFDYISEKIQNIRNLYERGDLRIVVLMFLRGVNHSCCQQSLHLMQGQIIIFFFPENTMFIQIYFSL